MYISINNFLPSISLHLDNPEDNENSIFVLVDAGATMNNDNLQYHLWVMNQYPEMVDDFFHNIVKISLMML